MIRNLATAIICDGKAPIDWEQSFIICHYKDRGDALDGHLSRHQADQTYHEDPREECQ